MSSTPSSGRKGGRLGGGRGRGKGVGKRGGRGRSNSNASRRSAENNKTSNVSGNRNDVYCRDDSMGSPETLWLPQMKDEEILIAFMPFMKGDNEEAIAIHENYQANNDQTAFLLAARQFLHKEKSRPNENMQNEPAQPPPTEPSINSSPTQSRVENASASAYPTIPVSPVNGHSNTNHKEDSVAPHNQQKTAKYISVEQDPFHYKQNVQDHHGGASPGMEILERKMAGLHTDADDAVPFPSVTGSTIGPSPSTTLPTHKAFESLFSTRNTIQQSGLASNGLQNNPQDNSVSIISQGNQYSTNPFSSLFASTSKRNEDPGGCMLHDPQNNQPSTAIASIGLSQVPPSTPPPPRSHPPPDSTQNAGTSTAVSPMHTPIRTSVQTPDTTLQLSLLQESTPVRTPRKEYQPKRLWTHFEEQPGRILANNIAPSTGTVVDLRPRHELTARWMLPLSYLQEQAVEQGEQSIRDLLKNLSVGLFRRGCAENGSQASIVSKEIVPTGGSREDYPFQVTQDSVIGSVPFYSPRTPGHVVFRMYWHDNPLHTLATGPTLNVRITESDFESSIRFILSNFKAKKVNPTSLSSLNSLALVLEQFYVSSNKTIPVSQHQLESAGRAVWGCVCEARKVLDACSMDYQKTSGRLQKLEEAVEELKLVGATEEDMAGTEKVDTDEDATQKSLRSGDGELSSNAMLLREKTKMLMSGRASCERKWRDSQLAFASILKTIVSNPSMGMLLRRELITKLRLEYELWCPLCEEFAVPGDVSDQMWYEPINRMSQPITAEHFRVCNEARSRMQMRILGFDPNFGRLENILYPTRERNRQMIPSAVKIFNQLSSSMGKLYQEVYFTADRILEQRERIRARTKDLVNRCECFPPGTEVAIFGSSANGYGSPMSDLDMCLQIPDGTTIVNEDDPTGAIAMATLAKLFEENGMRDVDTSRLTARIPVIKFNFPRERGNDSLTDEDVVIECDLSMHNPLAVLNTSLLRAYAEINPVSRVLASVIKRWAKARDINNPSRHTLSSYGYILMLLHFLTYHQRSGDGLVSPVDRNSKNQAPPLLPNLQWMDERWPQSPEGTPYLEYKDIPYVPLQHPLEESLKVNAYFYKPNQAMMNNLQRLFPGQDLSLAILLASFFRYYAYDFDYKRHVVSLNSTISHGVVEREVKAELDGWRNYSAALTIEDPFETFYDVAHVLRGGYYHRIRREFAVAYTKIADVASGKKTGSWGNRTVDLTTMGGMALIDWICEPVVNGD